GGVGSGGGGAAGGGGGGGRRAGGGKPGRVDAPRLPGRTRIRFRPLRTRAAELGAGAIRQSVSAQILPAVRREGRAGDETGVVGGEKDYAARDFLGLAQAPDRDVRQDGLLQTLIRSGPSQHGCCVVQAIDSEGQL